MSLQKTIEEIKKAQPYAKEDVEEGAPETLNGRRARKNKAVEDMKRLRREYKQGLMNSAVFIIVTGSEAKEFERASTEKFGCLSATLTGFYEDLASRVHPTLYLNKEFNGNVLDVVGRHLGELAGDLDINSYPMLQYKTSLNRLIKSKEELTELLTSAINQQVGGELAGIYAVHGLVDKAIKAEHAATVTPIVMTAESAKLAMDLVPALARLQTKVFLVLAGKGPKELKTHKGLLAIKVVTEESVEDVMNQIKSNLKK